MKDQDIDAEFNEYVKLGRKLPRQTPDRMLIAYGYFKQATEGDIKSDRPTENSDVVRTFMHDQWKRLRGMSMEEAKLLYIEFIRDLLSESGTTGYRNIAKSSS